MTVTYLPYKRLFRKQLQNVKWLFMATVTFPCQIERIGPV